MNSKALVYKDYVRPDAHVIAALYKASNLQRPVQDLGRLQRMYDHSPRVGPESLGRDFTWLVGWRICRLHS